MEQFLCVELLIGKEKLKKLRESSVTVIGLGAVGSYAVEALARAGVGALRLVDFDTLKPTNLNRHLAALHSTLGKFKADVLKDRVLDINPVCSVEALTIFADKESLPGIFSNKPDLVIDAIDSLNPKVQVLSECSKLGIPIVSSMGAALRINPFSVKTGDIFETKGCPLAQRIRKRLRKEKIGKGILCVYSDESCKHARLKGDVQGESYFERGRARGKMGSLPTVTGIFGLAVAHCSIEYLCGGFTIS